MSAPLTAAGRELMEHWVETLRSGTYTQAIGLLRRGDCFCALGVLCDIYDPGRWSQHEGHWVYEYSILRIPDSVAHALSLDTRSIPVTYDGDTRLVSELNDARCSFEEIANALEATYLRT